MGERNIEAIHLRGRNITMLYDFTPGVASGRGGNLDVTENPSGFEAAMVHGMWQDNNSSSGILAPSRRCAFCPPSFTAVSGKQGQGPLPLKLRLDGGRCSEFRLRTGGRRGRPRADGETHHRIWAHLAYNLPIEI
jgi:hypothetical protein